MSRMFTLFFMAFFIMWLGADACVPSGPMRKIIQHRIDASNGKVGMSDTVPLETSNEEAIESISAGGMSDFKSVLEKSAAQEKPSKDNISIANTTVISEEGNPNATVTFKPNTLDDPNFVPGSFLDSDGNTALINPPAVTDALADFLSRIEQHKSEFGSIAAVLIIDVVSHMINIIGLIWIVGLVMPLFRHVLEMKKRLPKKGDDKMTEARELAHLYMTEPGRFTAFHNASISAVANQGAKKSMSMKKPPKKALKNGNSAPSK